MEKADMMRLFLKRLKAAGTQRAAAREFGVSESYITDILKGRRMPGPKVLAALGLTRESRYQPIREEKP